MYLVMSMKRELVIEVGPTEVTEELCWAPGMAGALPVFDNREAAEAYAEGRDIEIVEVQ
jgi:hypothetical protein